LALKSSLVFFGLQACLLAFSGGFPAAWRFLFPLRLLAGGFCRAF